MSMPIRKADQQYYMSSYVNEGWISGIGFGKNLWNHAYNPAESYISKYNNKGNNTKIAIDIGKGNRN